MIFFNSRTKENKFWDWFTKKSNIYFKFEEDRENLFDELKVKTKSEIELKVIVSGALCRPRIGCHFWV